MKYLIRSRVYVAGPISVGDMRGNVERAIHMGELLTKEGYAVFVPHYDVLWNAKASVGTQLYEALLERDFSFIAACHAVLRLSGTSAGADREEAWANKIHVPIFYTVDDLLQAIPPRQLWWPE